MVNRCVWCGVGCVWWGMCAIENFRNKKVGKMRCVCGREGEKGEGETKRVAALYRICEFFCSSCVGGACFVVCLAFL